MSRPAAAFVAWTLFAVSAVLGLTGVGLTLASSSTSTLHYLATDGVAIAIFFVSGVVGALIASRLPTNPIGWIFLGLVVALGLSGGTEGYVALALDRGQDNGFVRWTAWYSSNVFLVLFATVLYSLLLFPNGRLPTRRWRVVLWTGTAGLLILSTGVLLNPATLDDYPQFMNPAAVNSPWIEWLFVPGFMLFLAGLIGAAASVVVRFRRARGVERQQLKLLVAAGSFAAVAFLASGFIGTFLSEDLSIALTLLAILAIPAAIGVAMLRYRLYEIDRVISRTLVYGVLTLILGAAYAGLVLAGQALFSSVAGGSNLSIAASTLVVAALFLPVRSRVQRLVDRRFYRRRYDAQRTLEAFGTRLRSRLELDGLRAGLEQVVGETMQPAHVSVWVRRGRP